MQILLKSYFMNEEPVSTLNEPPAATLNEELVSSLIEEANRHQLEFNEKGNLTLYCRNLNDRIGITKLRKALLDKFTPFGTIQEIFLHKSLKRRGQAWVLFEKYEDALNAKDALQNITLFNRQLMIAFARSKSDLIAKADGSFVPRKKKPIARTMATKHRVNAFGDSYNTLETPTHTQQLVSVNQTIMPNKTLFVEDLKTEEVNQDVLTPLFGGVPGFIEVRVIPGRMVAFVDYDSIENATNAKNLFDGFHLVNDVDKIKVTFAKM